MKPMTNSKARSIGKKQLRAVFKALRIKDALGDEEIKPDDIAYWYNKNRDGTVGNYIIYEVIDFEPMHRADDAVIGCDFFCQIDVFSLRSFESKQLSELKIKTVDDLCDLTDEQQTELLSVVGGYRFDTEFTLNFIAALMATARYPDKPGITDIIIEIPPHWIADSAVITELMEFLSLFITAKKTAAGNGGGL